MTKQKPNKHPYGGSSTYTKGLVRGKEHQYCDVCGLEYYKSELVENRGRMVCKYDIDAAEFGEEERNV